MTQRCRNCGGEMERITLAGGQGVEYSCEQCNDYKNADGDWRSQNPDEPGRVVKQVDSE